jgi:MSHA type pilus biogenesis protein MshL
MNHFFLLLCFPLLAHAALDRPVDRLHFDAAPLPVALRSVGLATHTTILIDPDVEGVVTVDLPPGTLGDALAALTRPLGCDFEERDGTIVVSRRRTVLYTVDYPQLTRSGSGSASITLGGATDGGSTGYGGTMTGGQARSGRAESGSDATQVSISQENQNTFWTGLEAELRGMLGEGDRLILNKFSGVLQVSAAAPTHDAIESYLILINHRITRQVEIEARLVEVALHEDRKLGVDWELAGLALGGGDSLDVGAPLDVGDVGGQVAPAGTFTATLNVGQATAVIRALAQQGEVRTVAQPRLRALNNQTAFIKIGQDQPFFRLQQATTFQQPGTTTPYNQTQEQFSVSTITIGTILAVTPQIDAGGGITLDVLPAITRLQAVVTSPDGRQTAPVTEVKQASTIVRLRDGETAVIGGLISEQTGEATRAIPVLGQMPLLGRAFRSTASVRRRTELVIFLTPKLVSR